METQLLTLVPSSVKTEQPTRPLQASSCTTAEIIYRRHIREERSSRLLRYLLNIRQELGDEALGNFVHGIDSWDDGRSVEREDDPELGATF